MAVQFNTTSSATAFLGYDPAVRTPPSVASSTYWCWAWIGNPDLAATDIFRINASTNVAGTTDHASLHVYMDSNGVPYVDVYSADTATVETTGQAASMAAVSDGDPMAIVVTRDDDLISIAWATVNASGTTTSSNDSTVNSTPTAPHASQHWGDGSVPDNGGTAYEGDCYGWAFHTYAASEDMPGESALASALLTNATVDGIFDSASITDDITATLEMADLYGGCNYRPSGGTRLEPDDTITTTNLITHNGTTHRAAIARIVTGTHKIIDAFGPNAPTLNGSRHWKRKAISSIAGKKIVRGNAKKARKALKGRLRRASVEVLANQSRATRRQSMDHPVWGKGSSNWPQGFAAANGTDCEGILLYNYQPFTTGAWVGVAGDNIGFYHTGSGSQTTLTNGAIQQSNHWACRYFPVSESTSTVVGGDIALLGSTASSSSVVALSTSELSHWDENTSVELTAYTIKCPRAASLTYRYITDDNTKMASATEKVASTAIDLSLSWEETGLTVATGAAGQLTFSGASDLIPQAYIDAMADQEDPDTTRICCTNVTSGEVNVITGASHAAGTWTLTFATDWATTPSTSDSIELGEFDIVKISSTSTGTASETYRALEITRAGDATKIKQPISLFGLQNANATGGRVFAHLGIGGKGYGPFVDAVPIWLITRVLRQAGADVVRWTYAPDNGYADSAAIISGIRKYEPDIEHIRIMDATHGVTIGTDSTSIPGYYATARATSGQERVALIDLSEATDSNGDPYFGSHLSQVAAFERDDQSHPNIAWFARAATKLNELELRAIRSGGTRVCHRFRSRR